MSVSKSSTRVERQRTSREGQRRPEFLQSQKKIRDWIDWQVDDGKSMQFVFFTSSCHFDCWAFLTFRVNVEFDFEFTSWAPWAFFLYVNIQSYGEHNIHMTWSFHIEFAFFFFSILFNPREKFQCWFPSSAPTRSIEGKIPLLQQ